MNWIDIFLFVVLGLSILWGLRTGLLPAIFAVIGAFIGFSVAGNFADDVGGLLSPTQFTDSIITVAAYWLIILVSIAVMAKVASMVRPIMVVATLGTAGLADRLGGLALGTLIGLIAVSAVIVTMARLAFDFEMDYPGISVPGTTITVDTDELPTIEGQRQSLVDALSDSAVVGVFLDVRRFLPGSMLGFVPFDFNAALGLLDEQIGN